MAIMSSGAGDARGRRSRLARAGRLTLALAGVAGLGLLASACGGSPAEGVARIDSTASTTTGSGSGDPAYSVCTDKTLACRRKNAAAYSDCMRKHGVTNFPDPDSEGNLKVTSGVGRNGQRTGVDVNSPQFRTAQQACQKLQPGGGRPNPQEQARERQAALAFSACMRSHGVPKYPDPEFPADGGVLMRIGKNAGVDPSSPQFKAAQKTCGKLFEGRGGANSIGPGPDAEGEKP